MENMYKASLVQQAFVGGALYPLSEDGRCIYEANGRTSCVEVDDPAHWKKLWEEKFSPARRNNSLDPSVYLKRNAKIKESYENYLAEKERVMDESIAEQASQVVAGTLGPVGAVAILAAVGIGIYLLGHACERLDRSDELDKDNHQVELEMNELKLKERRLEVELKERELKANVPPAGEDVSFPRQ